MQPTTISVIPKRETKDLLSYQPTDPGETERMRWVQNRIKQMFDAKSPYIPLIEMGYLLYDGIYLRDITNKTVKNENYVAPIAKIFVDSLVSQKAKAFSPFTYIPKEKEEDLEKVDILKDLASHAQDIVDATSKRLDMLHDAECAGVGIARVGYRRICGKRKFWKDTEDDMEQERLEYEEREEVVYDDIFMDIVSPLNFLIDPNASSLNDAIDCAYFYDKHIDEFKEMFSGKMWKNVDKVVGGQMGQYSMEGFVSGNICGIVPKEDMVIIFEYFNHILDAWVVTANGIEIGQFPLPDAHKKLPFFAYHNHISHAINGMGYSYSPDGKATSTPVSVRPGRSFWTVGTPVVIADLIELRTGHGRAAHRIMKRDAQRIIATRGNYKLPAGRDWLDGDTAEGALGNIDVLNLAGGGAGAGAWQFVFDDLFNLMRLALGIDPTNLADTKQKTATEAEIQNETGLSRLDPFLTYNETVGEKRFGLLLHKLMEERYTKGKVVKLTGAETPEELEKFDEVENDESGKPAYGKTYRRIRSKIQLKETKTGKKYTLSKGSGGAFSFLARPEYIKTSEIDIVSIPGRRAAQLRSVQFKKYSDLLATIAQILPFTQPHPVTGKPLLDPQDLPPIGKISEGIMRALDIDSDDKKSDLENEEEELLSNVEQIDNQSVSFSDAINAMKQQMQPMSSYPAQENAPAR